MKAYIIKRLLTMIPIVFGVMLITFLLFSVVGGDRSLQIAGKAASAETIAEIKHERGWDKPLLIPGWQTIKSDGPKAMLDTQFFRHLWGCLTFNFGKSIVSRESIADIIKSRAGASLSLMIPMFFIGLGTSLTISLIVAYLRGTWVDLLLVLVCVIGMSVPFLVYILMGQWLFAYKLDWFPSIYAEPGWSYTRRLALPVLIGVVSGLGASVRFYRTVILDEIHADYVRTARAKGASTTRVLFKHVLKNAMIPIITQVVLAIPFLFLGSLLLERFFSIPGLGDLMVSAINSSDDQVIIAMTYIGALLYVAGVLVTDICYAFVDPRVELR